MGKAVRWLKGLFGIKRDRETDNKATNFHVRTSNDPRDKRASSFGRSSETAAVDGLCNNPETIPPNLSTAEAAWVRSYYSQTEQEQSKHAIAVAAATAAAADAAVAAAQAAVAVVRLTSQGRGTMFGGSHERWASVKIQTVFRGYLARKALRALRGLVKLQAAVRGFLVRKQATATLRSMQALIRAQSAVRSHKMARSLFLSNHRFDPKARKSMDRFDHDNNVNTNNDDGKNTGDHYYGVPSHSRRLSAASIDPNFIDEAPKIVEVDTGRPKSRSRRTTGDDASSSPAPCRRISIPDSHYYYYNNNYSSSSEWGVNGEEYRWFSTAQSTPRFCGECGAAPGTPAKSVCGGDFFPNYMSNTKSFKAKLRSYSAPKQRPGLGPKQKRLDVAESRISLSGVRMRRSCSQAQEAITFKNAVVSNLECRDTDHRLAYNN